MSEPTTEAGRRLWNDLAFAAPETWPMHIDRRIQEAEDEARATVLRELRDELEWEPCPNILAAIDARLGT